MNRNEIVDPVSNEIYSIFSSQGRNILKNYIVSYKNGGGKIYAISNANSKGDKYQFGIINGKKYKNFEPLYDRQEIYETFKKYFGLSYTKTEKGFIICNEWNITKGLTVRIDPTILFHEINTTEGNHFLKHIFDTVQKHQEKGWYADDKKLKKQKITKIEPIKDNDDNVSRAGFEYYQMPNKTILEKIIIQFVIDNKTNLGINDDKIEEIKTNLNNIEPYLTDLFDILRKPKLQTVNPPPVPKKPQTQAEKPPLPPPVEKKNANPPPVPQRQIVKPPLPPPVEKKNANPPPVPQRQIVKPPVPPKLSQDLLNDMIEYLKKNEVKSVPHDVTDNDKTFTYNQYELEGILSKNNIFSVYNFVKNSDNNDKYKFIELLYRLFGCKGYGCYISKYAYQDIFTGKNNELPKNKNQIMTELNLIENGKTVTIEQVKEWLTKNTDVTYKYDILSVFFPEN